MDEKSTNTLNSMMGSIKQRHLARFIAKQEHLTTDEVLSNIHTIPESELQEYIAQMEQFEKERDRKRAEEDAKKAEEQSQLNAAAKKRDSETQSRFKKNQYDIFVNSIPEHYKNADIEHIFEKDNPQKNELISNLLDGESGLFTGGNGIGKTYMGWAMAKHWKVKGESVEFLKGAELLARIKEHQLENPYKYITDHYGKECQHLIIDEIDKIRATDADYVYLTYLCDIRYDHNVQTIFFGNLKNGQSNKDLLPQSIYSRLMEIGEVLTLNGKDRRVRK